MNDRTVRKFYPVFTLLALFVGGLVIVAFYKDQFREWKEWQKKYTEREMARVKVALGRAQR